MNELAWTIIPLELPLPEELVVYPTLALAREAAKQCTDDLDCAHYVVKLIACELYKPLNGFRR